MNDRFSNLYEQFVKGIEEIERNNPDFRKQIESCFHLSENIRQQVEKMISGTAFENQQEEIDFFKNIKPKFTSAVEFYSILYRAELFIPDNNADKSEFWNYELQRAETYLTRNEDFLHYLKSGDTSEDEKYFVRESADSFSAMHDELIAKLFAREKYIEYIKTRIIRE